MKGSVPRKRNSTQRNVNSYHLRPKFTSSHNILFTCYVLVFVFLIFFLCNAASSFIISLLCWPLQSVLGFFLCPLSHCFSLVLILPSVTSNIFICGLDQCSSNFFKVLSLAGFHRNPRVPGVGSMSSSYTLLKLFYHHSTIPFECVMRKTFESLRITELVQPQLKIPWGIDKRLPKKWDTSVDLGAG